MLSLRHAPKMEAAMNCEPRAHRNAAEIGSFNGVIFFDKQKNEHTDSSDCDDVQERDTFVHISLPVSEYLRKTINQTF